MNYDSNEYSIPFIQVLIMFEECNHKHFVSSCSTRRGEQSGFAEYLLCRRHSAKA